MAVYLLCFSATLWLAQGFFRIVFSLKAFLNFTTSVVDLLHHFLLEVPVADLDKIPTFTLNTSDALVGDHLFDTIPPVPFSDDFYMNQTESHQMRFKFSWYDFVYDITQSSEQSMTGLFFYEIYQCVCSTEVRASIDLLTQVIHILVVISLSLFLRALQELVKFLLINVAEVHSWPSSLVHFGLIQSLIILIGMIYMTVEIVISMKFRE